MQQIDLVALDDEGKRTVQTGELIVYIPCLGSGCLKKFRDDNVFFQKAEVNIIVKRIYGAAQNIVCPHCGQKLKVRCYKNGSVKEEIR